jgi:hypothetical protein
MNQTALVMTDPEDPDTSEPLSSLKKVSSPIYNGAAWGHFGNFVIAKIRYSKPAKDLKKIILV